MDSELIERIVQEVIRRLLAGGVGIAQPKSLDDTLRIEDRVVTLATLDGHLQGVRRVRVNGKAVVTPAVRDKLRELKIELSRSE